MTTKDEVRGMKDEAKATAVDVPSSFIPPTSDSPEILRRIEVLEVCLLRIVTSLTGLRAATIMDLGCIEDALAYERSIMPRSQGGHGHEARPK